MKLAALLVVALLGGTAHAGRARAHGPRKQALRAAVIQQFDRNGDGVLEPRERRQAAKALKRLAKRMQHGGKRAQQGKRQARKQAFIRRYDLNHDGNIGPGEMPPALANELRPLDRDGNGWLQGSELP